MAVETMGPWSKEELHNFPNDENCRLASRPREKWCGACTNAHECRVCAHVLLGLKNWIMSKFRVGPGKSWKAVF